MKPTKYNQFLMPFKSFNSIFIFSILFISSIVTPTPPKLSQASIPNIASRLGESVLLECGAPEHELLKQLESSVPSMPVLVNWFKHYSLTRRSDKPIYAKYLANNIDYAPHVSRDYESRLQVVDKINLNISNLKAVDEALYECRLVLFDKAYADSQIGSMFYLQVHVAPEFEYPNEEIVYFKPNVPIRLYCYAKGKPTPTITWYKNDVKLEANTSVLQETFPEDTADMFEFRCKVENTVGQIEHTVKVIRSGSLFFTEPLKNITVTEGTILNWPCLAQSNAEITYKWFKDSISVQSILHKWSERGALFQDGMLYLLETYRNDSGLYECHAYTANKRIETSAYLNVLYGPEIVPFSSPIFSLEGSHSVVLDCVVRSNPAIVALEWFKDKYLLSNTNKYQILPNNSLLIRNVQKNDRGQYYCTCNNTIKKAVSPVVRLEIVDSKKSEITTLYTSSSQTSFKLPCRSILLPNTNAQSYEAFDYQIDSDSIRWYKINSKLPQNRYKIEADGSLNLQNLRASDSGMYLCKINEQYLQTSVQTKLSKSILQNSIEKGFSTEKIIRLNVIPNKNASMETTPSESASSEYSANEITTELPLSPENIQINQTTSGILLTWQYPKQTPVKIEYFQIYFREINEKQYTNNYEWKTTESILSNVNNYFIDDSNLMDDQLYEFQLVSFSVYSKSLPSQTIKFKYLPRVSNVYTKPSLITFALHTTTISMPILAKFLNMSQLDYILITIFLILLLILILCIVACVVYRRTSRSMKKKRNKKMEIDDWGFQSSAATATFLSSASSSEKSYSTYNAKKPQRHSAIDCDLSKSHGANDDYKEKIPINNNNTKKKTNESSDDDVDEINYRINMLNPNPITMNPNIHIINEDDDDFYYPTQKKLIKTSIQKRNSSAYSNNTTTGIGTSSNTSETSATSSVKSNNNNTGSSNTTSDIINNTSGTSSGITSVSGTSSSCNSEIDHEETSDSLHVTNDSVHAVNTIKYNAKTNILQHHSNSLTKKIHFKGDLKYNEGHKTHGAKLLVDRNEKLINLNNRHSLLKANYSNTMKNTTNKQISFSNYSPAHYINTLDKKKYVKVPKLIVNSATDTDKTESGDSVDTEGKKMPDYTNLNGMCLNGCNELSGISLDVDTSLKQSDSPIAKTRYSHLVMAQKDDSPKLQLKDENEHCFNWLSEVTSPSMTPVESSTYSNTSITPPLAANGQKLYSNQAEILYASKTPMPFPTNHFGLAAQQDLSRAFLQLNSGSSLTMVSKVPSSSYCFINENNDKHPMETQQGGMCNNIYTGSSSSSSGCSSLDNPNQYYVKTSENKLQLNAICNGNHHYQGETAPEYTELFNPNKDYSPRSNLTLNHQRNSTNLNSLSKQIDGKKYQQFSTYKPILKSSNATNSNNNNRKSSNTVSNSFRASKIDYV